MDQNDGSRQMFRARAVITVAVLICILILTVGFFGSGDGNGKEMATSEFLSKAEAGEFVRVETQDYGPTRGWTGQGESDFVVSYLSPKSAETLAATLKAKGVEYREIRPEGPSQWAGILWVVVILAFLFFMMKRGSGGGLMSGFGQAKAGQGQASTVRFTDVAGLDEIMDDIRDIVGFLKDPSRFTDSGARIPKGVLLTGSPGTGKTLMAKAVAGEAGVPFFTMSGSDFVEMYVGVGAARVRSLFEQAQKAGRCIIFIDEIDGVGRKRSADGGNNSQEHEQTLNALLVAMDGFGGRDGIVVLAATNRPDMLDPGLLRPGRFDRKIEVPMPDIDGRTEIFRVHTRNIRLADGIDLRRLARKIGLVSGADIEEICNEAALLSVRDGEPTVTERMFDQAIEKVHLGAEKRGLAVRERDRKAIACHEAGHAVVALHLPEHPNPDKVSIVARMGGAGGVTHFLPEEGIALETREELKSQIAVLLAGRAAEEEMIGTVTPGASNDIERATAIAKAMVYRLGMAEGIPTRTYGPPPAAHAYQAVYGGQDYSERTAILLDEAVGKLLTEGMKTAARIITNRHKDMDALVEALLERETLGAEEIREAVKR